MRTYNGKPPKKPRIYSIASQRGFAGKQTFKLPNQLTFGGSVNGNVWTIRWLSNLAVNEGGFEKDDGSTRQRSKPTYEKHIQLVPILQ